MTNFSCEILTESLKHFLPMKRLILPALSGCTTSTQSHHTHGLRGLHLLLPFQAIHEFGRALLRREFQLTQGFNTWIATHPIWGIDLRSSLYSRLSTRYTTTSRTKTLISLQTGTTYASCCAASINSTTEHSELILTWWRRPVSLRAGRTS